jgi:hypothetical protein
VDFLFDGILGARVDHLTFQWALVLVPTRKTSTLLFKIPWFQSLHHAKHNDNFFQEAIPQNA